MCSYWNGLWKLSGIRVPQKIRTKVRSVDPDLNLECTTLHHLSFIVNRSKCSARNTKLLQHWISWRSVQWIGKKSGNSHSWSQEMHSRDGDTCRIGVKLDVHAAVCSAGRCVVVGGWGRSEHWGLMVLDRPGGLLHCDRTIWRVSSESLHKGQVL